MTTVFANTLFWQITVSVKTEKKKLVKAYLCTWPAKQFIINIYLLNIGTL